MATNPAYDPGSSRFGHLSGVENGTIRPDRRRMIQKLSLLAAVFLLLFLAPRAVAQNSPKITGVAPSPGRSVESNDSRGHTRPPKHGAFSGGLVGGMELEPTASSLRAR